MVLHGSHQYTPVMLALIYQLHGSYGPHILSSFHLSELPSGKRANITNWTEPPFLMGKSTISTGPFSIATLNYQRVSTPTPKHVFEGGGYGKNMKRHFSSSKIDSPGPPPNTCFDEGRLKNIGSMGRDIHPHRIFILGGWSVVYILRACFFQDPRVYPGMYFFFFSGEYTSLENSILGGLGRQKAHHFWRFYTSS